MQNYITSICKLGSFESRNSDPEDELSDQYTGFGVYFTKQKPI